MVTAAQVWEALRTVKDPELGKDLVDLGMVRDVVVEDGCVRLTVVLTIAGCPLKQKIKDDVVQAVQALGVSSVDVVWGEMTEAERKDLSDRLRREREGGSGKTRPPATWLAEQGVVCIAVASGKGGVGKSTVAVNLAVAMAEAGHRVGIVDADIYGFSVPDLMAIQRRPVVIDETVLPVEQYGVQVMSMGFFVDDNAPVIWRGPMLGKMLRNFFTGIHWNQLSHLIIDLPPGTGDVALDIHQMVPQCKQILVTTPHPSASFVAIRAGTMAMYKTKHELLGVVENMSWYENRAGEKEFVFGQGGGQKVAESLEIPLLKKLPLVAPGETGDAVYRSGHPLHAAYQQLAAELLNQIGTAAATSAEGK